MTNVTSTNLFDQTPLTPHERKQSSKRWLEAANYSLAQAGLYHQLSNKLREVDPKCTSDIVNDEVARLREQAEELEHDAAWRFSGAAWAAREGR